MIVKIIFLVNPLDKSTTTIYNVIVFKSLYLALRKEDSVNTQYKKGVLELCVLSLLKKRDCYGYEISEYLSRHIDIADGTVYPILRKLKSEGLLTTYLQEESGGPPRKYYSLTDLGANTYRQDRGEYLKFSRTIETLLKEDEHDEA